MNSGKKTIPEAGYETVALTECLGKLEPGDLATYVNLSKTCGRDVRTIARSALMSARRRAERDYGVVVECVRNEGYKRVDGAELLNAQSSGLKRIRNEARRRTRRLGLADWSKLSQEEKGRLNAQLSAYGVVQHLAKSQSIKKLASQMTNTEAKPLPIGRTLEFFQKGGDNGDETRRDAT